MVTTRKLPQSFAESARRAAIASDALNHIAMLFNPEVEAVYTSFLGDALPGEWAAVKKNGSNSLATVALSQLTLTSGGDNDGYTGQGYGLFWKADNGLYFSSEQAIDSIADSKLETGLTWATTDAGAVNVKATPSATAEDFVVAILDSDDVSGEFDVISQTDNTGISAAAEDIYTVVGGTNFRTEFKAQGDACAVYVNNQHVASAGFQGGDLVSPWWFCQTRTTSSKVLTVEWMLMVGYRA